MYKYRSKSKSRRSSLDVFFFFSQSLVQKRIFNKNTLSDFVNGTFRFIQDEYSFSPYVPDRILKILYGLVFFSKK